MGILDLFLDAPAIPGVLRLLKENGGSERRSSVVQGLPDRTYTEQAIDTLRAQGIIEERDGLLSIVEGEVNARRIEGIIRFYASVDTAARRRLLFRGILNSAQYACLVNLATLKGLMETEGVRDEETEGLIEKEASLGFVERLPSSTGPGKASPTSRSPSYPSITTPISSP